MVAEHHQPTLTPATLASQPEHAHTTSGGERGIATAAEQGRQEQIRLKFGAARIAGVRVVVRPYARYQLTRKCRASATERTTRSRWGHPSLPRPARRSDNARRRSYAARLNRDAPMPVGSHRSP